MSVKALTDKSQRAQFHLNQIELPIRNLHISYGTTGESTLWVRGDGQLNEGVALYSDILTKTFDIKPEDRTLVIIGFYMGAWVAGNYSVLAFHEITYRFNFNITLYPAGSDGRRVLPYMSQFMEAYDHIVLLGMPPVIQQWISQFPPCPEVSAQIYSITSAMRASPAWKRKAVQRLGHSSRETNHVNLYGSADAGIIAYETRLTMAVNQLAGHYAGMREWLNGDLNTDAPCALMQFHSEYIDIVDDHNEICISTRQHVIPLDHYHTGDHGRRIELCDVRAYCENKGLMTAELAVLFAEFDQPFLVMQGRSLVSLVYAHEEAPHLIVPELLVEAIELLQDQYPELSGSLLYFIDTHDDRPIVRVVVGLLESANISPMQTSSLATSFVAKIAELNSHMAIDIAKQALKITVESIEERSFEQRCAQLQNEGVQFVYKSYDDKARMYKPELEKL